MPLAALTPALSDLEKDLHARFGMNAAAFNAEGARITSFANWGNPLCPRIKGDPASAKAICAVANQHFMRLARETGRTACGECDAGFIKFCAPILDQGRFLGVVGGCGLLPPGEEVNAEAVLLASTLAPAEVARLAAECRTMSAQDLDRAMDFVNAALERILSGRS